MYILTRFSQLTLAFGLMIVSAHAGQEDSSGIEMQLLECDQISDSAAKLACIEVVINGIKQEEIPDTTSPDEPGASESSTLPAPAGAATAGAAGGAATSQAEAVMEEPAGQSVADEAPLTEPEDIAPDVSATEEFGLEDQIAAEQKEELKKIEEEVDEIRATIVDSWITIDRRFEVLLDNGQIWRETELTRTPRLPKAGIAVRITRASLGSYRMKIGSNNRLAAVRRTR